MGKVEFHAIQCAQCGLYQVQQVKKDPQFKCTVCKKQQKLQDEHFRGPAKQCREIVQRFNRARHEGELPFTPLPVDSLKSAAKVFEKRKPTSSVGENHSKRLKDANSVDEIGGPGATELVQMSDDEELFPPETAGDTTSRAISDLSIQRTPNDNNQEPMEKSRSEAKVKSVRYVDDDDIFDDISTPPRSPAEAVVGNQSATQSNVPESSKSLFSQPCQQNEGYGGKKNSTGEKKRLKEPAEAGGEKSNSRTSVMVPRSATEESAAEIPGEVEKLENSEKRASIAKTEVKGSTTIQEGWRRRSLNKLAKFKFDADDDSDSTRTKVAPISVASHSIPISSSKKSFEEEGLCHEKSEPRQKQATASESSTKNEKKSEDAPGDSPSAPEGGRGRLLATLEKFGRAPCAKQKLK